MGATTRRTRRARPAAWLAAALLLGACSPAATPAPSTTFVLHVLNIDGPTVGIAIGEQVVATVPCGGGTDLRPGQGEAPPLPWTVQVRAPSGAVLGSASYPAFAGAETSLQVRGGKVLSGSLLSGGPSADPNACAPSSSASPGG
jgi:hypothetical protein